jgi:hypothetical protein
LRLSLTLPRTSTVWPDTLTLDNAAFAVSVGWEAPLAGPAIRIAVATAAPSPLRTE